MQSQPAVQRITDVPRLAARPADAHKGVFGRVLVVAGSRGMSGAGILCASGALRGGAGLVRLAVPEGQLTAVTAANPCYTTAPLPEAADGRFAAAALPALLEQLAAHDVCALGPGLGQSGELELILRGVLTQSTLPLVLDADALNLLPPLLSLLGGRPTPPVLTPHPGEFARLTGATIAAVQAAREEVAVRFAAAQRVVLVLKGHETIVTDGRELYVNTTGNPGMATGGSGDVLTGLIAALLGQRLGPFAAARLGVYLHGLAGDLARDDLGEVSLIATDLLNYLPRAFRAHAERGGRGE
jgi:ADP-dependent NAD(P)H-hydrate dehydratase